MPASPQRPPHPGHDVVRGDPGRLVAQDDAVGHVISGELLRHFFTQERDQLVTVQRRGEAGGLAVPAATLGARDRRDIDPLVAGPQRDLARGTAAVVGDSLTDKRGHRRALDRPQVVDDALRVALLGTRLGEVAGIELGHREPPAVVAGHLGEPAGQQRELAVGHALVHAAVDLVHVDPSRDQVGRHQVRPRSGVLVHEATGVGDETDVERLRDVQRGLHPEPLHEVPHDLGRARRLGQHVVDGAEPGVVVVVVDVDDVRASATEGHRGIALEVAAVEEHDRASGEVLGRRLHQPREREEAVLVGHRELARVDEHQAVAAQPDQDLLHGDERPERVAVHVFVGDDDQLLGRAELGQDLVTSCRPRTVLMHLAPTHPAPDRSGVRFACRDRSTRRTRR